MANKIESAIKKLMSKNERGLQKAKKRKVVEAVSDSTLTDEQMIAQEMKRRKIFAAGGAGKRAVIKKRK